MSEVAARPARPGRGRRFDLLAMLAIGVVIVAAALLPAVTANSGETTTVRGDVTLNGQPLAFFPVGFWTTSSPHVAASTTTDENGGFTFPVSATLDGFAYAGTTPDSQHAILEIDGKDVVRGVVSTEPAGSPPSALYQGRPTATAHALSGGASLVHFKLAEAGRITGISPIAASGVRAVQVRRADNSVVQTLKLDAESRFRSMLLAPGQYGVALVPKSPGLPTVANALVESGGTTTVTLPTPVAGATVTGVVRTGFGPVGSGVPVLLEQDGEVLAATTTASTGDWSFTGIAAGDYSVEVGRFDEPAASGASTVEVPIPGATSTPTPTASTASPSPAATAVAPQDAAIAPVERTADAVLPETFGLTVPDVLGEVSVATNVDSAGRIAGMVTRADPISGTESATSRVVVEEADTGRIVRAAAVSGSGEYSVGGLDPGARYRVWAVTQPEDPTLAQMGEASAVATATTTTADVVITQPALTVTGTVSNATSGRVTAGDTQLLQRTSTIDSSGAYALQGLVPGAYAVVVTAGGRETSQPVGVVASAAQPVVDLEAGPRAASFKGWFIATGAGVPVVTGSAVDATGDVVQFGPKTNDGRISLSDLAPGTYEYDADSFRGTVPMVDGPWYYAPPTDGFTLSDGAAIDVGPILLHVHTH